MNNPTDTNQTGEDEKAIMIGFLCGIQSDFLPADEVRHRMAGFRHTQDYKDAIELINTQKRLYAESEMMRLKKAILDERQDYLNDFLDKNKDGK